MADAVSKFERLMNLVAFLLASQEPVPFSEIRKRVIGYNDRAREDAVEKRFDRDKKELREMGIPVEYVAGDEHGRDGYYIPLHEYYHDELELGDDEAALLAVLGNAARGGNDAISFNLRSAHLKMAIDSPLPEQVQEEATGNYLLALSRGRKDRGTLDNLDKLVQAVSQRRRIRFKYQKPGARQAEAREVHPFGVGYRDGEWYVVGEDQQKGELRQFKVARITGAVQLPGGARRRNEYEVPAGFDIDDHLQRGPWEFQGGKEEWAKILFHADVAWMVAENRRADQKFETRKDGTGVLSMKVRKSDATHQHLLSWLAQFAGQCAVLSPAWLRRQAMDHLKALRERYG